MHVKVMIVVRAIQMLPVVTLLSPLATSSTNKPGYRVGLRCFSLQDLVSCGQQHVRTI